MKELKDKYSGIAVPVGALRTKNSCGTGEFLDLKKLADFCSVSGISLIQILPVNDTGTESSPYSALSAFALHPIYISLKAVKGSEDFEGDIKSLKKKYDFEKRFSYREVRQEKLGILRKIFEKNYPTIKTDANLKKWIKDNPWVKFYSVYMGFKARYNEASWKEWAPKDQKLSEKEIMELWADSKKESDNLFSAWIQYNLDLQFSEAAKYIRKKGIILKGDIPIMMNEDSCDAWAYPRYFRDDLRAGCPPDGFNPLGQNWGFPIYNWKNLEEDDFSWWKNRLKTASKYYQAFRIDHVLGFFRIWAISERDYTGYCGYPDPSAPITAEELERTGFSGDRLRWISVPHIPTSAVQNVLQGNYQEAVNCLNKVASRLNGEELWLFKDSIKGEKDIYSTDLPDPVKNELANQWRDRLLVKIWDGTYRAIWSYRNSKAWNSLSDQEKNTLRNIIDEKGAKSQKLWEEQARKLLGVLTSCTDMIPCAEDLGANPDCVPGVLNDLQIHGLKVLRWNRNWNAPGQPWYRLEEHPLLSVVTPAVHDTSTLRGWWNDEGGKDDILGMWGTPAQKSALNGEYCPQAAAFVLKTLSYANSRFCIVQIQDLLDLIPDYYSWTSDDERINKPGSVNTFNWTYRIPDNLEILTKNQELTDSIRRVFENRI